MGKNMGRQGSYQDVGRAIHKLSVKQIAATNEPGYYGDGGNLYLQVSRSGTKSWIVRYTFAGRKHDMGIGPVRDVPLAKAREKAATVRAQLMDGVDPISERTDRRLANAPGVAFSGYAEEFIETNQSGWKNAKHAEQWRNTLTTYAYPVIGQKPPREVTTDDMMDILKPIWSTKNETASRVRGRVEQILAYAKVKERHDRDNPATWKGHLEQLLPKPSKVKKVKHMEALPFAELPAFMVKLRAMPGIAARALEFTILTCARTTEVTDAPPEEFDLERARWVVPKERMKAGKEHRSPLVEAALEILRSVPSSSAFVFPSPRTGEPLSESAMLAVLNRMGLRGITVHGFRSTFRDWAAEVGNHPAELAEMALAHTLGDKVEAAYRRGDMFKKRVALAEDWAAFCL